MKKIGTAPSGKPVGPAAFPWKKTGASGSFTSVITCFTSIKLTISWHEKYNLASKAAAYIFQESLRVEMKSLNKNICCTTTSPLFINTGMFKGVKLPVLKPVLEQKVLVRRTMNAILQEENGEVFIPWKTENIT